MQAWALWRISVADLPQILPACLKRVKTGESLQVPSYGRVIASIKPKHDPAAESREWLDSLRNRLQLVDVIIPIEDQGRSADADLPCSMYLNLLLVFPDSSLQASHLRTGERVA